MFRMITGKQHPLMETIVLVPELLLRCGPAVMFGVKSVQNLFQGLVRLGGG